MAMPRPKQKLLIKNCLEMRFFDLATRRVSNDDVLEAVSLQNIESISLHGLSKEKIKIKAMRVLVIRGPSPCNAVSRYAERGAAS